MYQTDDITSAIKEVQRLLNIPATGFYEQETRDAVMKIQSAVGLEATGITDYKTFVALVKAYNERLADTWDCTLLFSPRFPFKPGDSGDNVGRINEAISELLKDYSYEGVFPFGKYYGTDTADAVRFLRGVFLLEESDDIDRKLMRRISEEIRAIEIKKYNT